MDVKALVKKMRNQCPSTVEDIKGRYNEAEYGPMKRPGDDEDDVNCNFRIGFSPQVGDILVLKDGDVYLVGSVNTCLGLCSCCGLRKNYDEYVGFIPVETWAVWLNTHDLP